MHAFADELVAATQINRPFEIEHLNEGDRDVHSIAGLSDWSVLMPFGPIDRLSFDARRHVGYHREEILRIRR